MTDFARARFNMVESQIRPSEVYDERLLAALLSVPRERFVGANWARVAYADEDLPLGGGRYLMEPCPFARLIQAAGVRSTDVVLVVGAGTGYGAAVLADLASAVVALEEREDLATIARSLLADLGKSNVIVETGALVDGWAAQAPYDVILIEGGVEEVPPAILGQLAEGGRLVAVVREEGRIGRGTIVTRSGAGFAHRAEFDANVPVMPGFARPRQFVF